MVKSGLVLRFWRPAPGGYPNLPPRTSYATSGSLNVWPPRPTRESSNRPVPGRVIVEQPSNNRVRHRGDLLAARGSGRDPLAGNFAVAQKANHKDMLVAARCSAQVLWRSSVRT